ncbi:hypothetical protein PENSPDRAFT_753506 [Peniophora sp. CONT]|nr:hypothetical protein PENSPDRAFT_753506 [Peniophora sp. CONT]
MDLSSMEEEYKLYSAVRQPQTEIDSDIDIYICKRPVLLHFGYVVDFSKARDYAMRTNLLINRKTGLPLDWNNPPSWVKSEEGMCMQNIVSAFSRRHKFSFGYASVIGPEGPLHMISLCTNRQDVAFATRLQNHLLRAIRDAFGIQEQEQSPKWWWDDDECGVGYKCEVAQCCLVRLGASPRSCALVAAVSQTRCHPTDYLVLRNSTEFIYVYRFTSLCPSCN